ncbi:MAG: tetratricopeptide repeat protein [Gammaproteobacteria bacterium]|nr:MAG: tetratricopeptide repeat protein [Gammaproteobacteria bacterium]
MAGGRIVKLGVCGLFLILTLAGCVTTVNDPLTAKASSKKAVEEYVNLGLGYFQQQQYDLAIKRLRRALEIDPGNPRALSALALVYQAQQEPELAEKTFLDVIREHPEFTQGRSYYAAFLYQNDRLEDALAQLREASNDVEYEGRALLFFNIGQIERRLGHNERAIEAYRKSLVLNPAQPRVRLALAFAYSESGQHEQAWKAFLQYRESVRRGLARHSAASVALGVRTARALGLKDEEASLLLLLKNQYRNSKEARDLLGEP